MLDSVYHMTMKLLKHHSLGVTRPLNYATKSVNHYWFIILSHSVMSLPDGMCVTKKSFSDLDFGGIWRTNYFSLKCIVVVKIKIKYTSQITPYYGQFLDSLTLTLTLKFLFKANCHVIVTKSIPCSKFLKEEAKHN